MKIRYLISLIFISFLLNSVSFAGRSGSTDLPTLADRCIKSNLDVSQAHGRNAWIIKCEGQIRHPNGKVIPSLAEFTRLQDNAKPTPLYGLLSDNQDLKWDAPISSSASCDGLYTKLHAWCISSCYTPEAEILFDDGYTKIKEAVEMRKMGIVALSKNSSIDDLIYEVLPVGGYSRSIKDSEEDIRTVKIEDGTHLRITTAHPVLIGENTFDGKFNAGTMVRASDLRVGYYLLKNSGEHQKIISIKDSKYFGKVYNVYPKSDDQIENIIVANGILVGSALYQYSELFKDLMYRQILRSDIDLSSLSK